MRASTKAERDLAREYNLNRATVRKWRRRETGEDASHRPHRIHATLSPVREQVVVALRQTLLLPLDDLLAVTRKFIHPGGLALGPGSLSAAPRRLQPQCPDPATGRRGQAGQDLQRLRSRVGPHRGQIPAADAGRGGASIPVCGASRWVYVEILPEKTARNAAGFLERLIAKAPFTITRVLTDNGKEFTDRFGATGEREPTGRHRFDQGGAGHGIEHRLIASRHPQTNGRVERFNGRLAEVLATTRFDSAQNPADTLTGYVRLDNHQIPQKALGHIAPIQALKDWQQKCPERFKQRVYNLTGLDTYQSSKPSLNLTKKQLILLNSQDS
ncbi:IS481 family transposase [Allochromatium tepidum]|uniref:IS481 family transposase n=1 Tax=Allochromatium tepidum TaxID=553982 RepID=A0ABM7QIE6_9GAMM|nr:IS481 family transposase [Allochromatium tepidum]